MTNEELLTCYHKGCGKKYNSNDNSNNACKYHPGEPVFHDAYKGWSCCNKKCTDFTEFLNIPGCTVSQHSNEKPPEPKPIVKESNPEEVIEVKPVVPSTLKRPPFDTPMVTLKPELAPSLKQQKQIEVIESSATKVDENIVTVGTSCKNGGCTKSYEGPDSDSETCIYHPGCPIFHEGMKFWSCCQRKTSDFNTFLNQEGCERGSHLWIKKDSNKEEVECRWDWHQTGNFVVLTVYAKQYCPNKSFVQINPIRVNMELVFPLEGNSFKLDLELTGIFFRIGPLDVEFVALQHSFKAFLSKIIREAGNYIIDVEQSQCSMFGTKVEVKLRKAELGSWTKLNFPQKVVQKKVEKKEDKVAALSPQIDAVDLDDL